MLRWVKVNADERGLLFRDGVFVRLLGPGRHILFDPLLRLRIDKVSLRNVWLAHPDRQLIAKSGGLAGQAVVVDLKDHERAVVWMDGRILSVCDRGVYVLWTVFREIRVEKIDARQVLFEHPDLPVILAADDGDKLLESALIPAGSVGLAFHGGRLVATLPPGLHAMWKGEGFVKVFQVDLREQSADVSGQEIMTADKVSLRLNALVTYRVADPVKAVTEVDGYVQAIYRQAQLALRAVVGTRELDALLADKDGVTAEIEASLRTHVEPFGIEVRSVGVRDIILPGEMREILNRVTEARKAAEAALITRREETAAMRSQANTARIFESNPTLMRLRELEVLERVAGKANLSVILGEGGLADRVVKLL